MSILSIWLLFVAVGPGTFTLRFLFIYLFGKIEMPNWLSRALRFVPAAALAALVFPALTHPAGQLDISLNNFRLLAGVGGAIVAWRTRNVLLTILVGMAILWMLEAMVGMNLELTPQIFLVVFDNLKALIYRFCEYS